MLHKTNMPGAHFGVATTSYAEVNPSRCDTAVPSRFPTMTPTADPTLMPTTPYPTLNPSAVPTVAPTFVPSRSLPTARSRLPSPPPFPSALACLLFLAFSEPTRSPTVEPTTSVPTFSIADGPTNPPTFAPTLVPTKVNGYLVAARLGTPQQGPWACC